MIHEFDSLEQLNDYYIHLLADLGQVTMQIGTSADELIRKGILYTYSKQLELVHFNDDFEIALRKKQLKRYRKSLKTDDDFSKAKLNVSVANDRKINRTVIRDLKKNLFKKNKDESSSSNNAVPESSE